MEPTEWAALTASLGALAGVLGTIAVNFLKATLSASHKRHELADSKAFEVFQLMLREHKEQNIRLDARLSEVERLEKECAVAMTAAKTEITHLKHSIEDLQIRLALKEEEMLSHEVDGDAVITVTSNGVIHSWTPTATKMFGFTPRQAIGREVSIIIPKRFQERHKEGIRRAFQEGAPLQYDTVCTTASKKDGSEFPVEIKLSMDISRTFCMAVISKKESNEQPAEEVVDQ